MSVSMDDAWRLGRLVLPDVSAGPVDAVLDTDTYNEIDDQFALAYMLVSPERIRLEAVYAAPFHNPRSAGPGDGMAKSYDEILRVFERMGRSDGESMARRGSEAWMDDAGPVKSPAADDLIDRAMARDPQGPPLYVVAIGAPTNVSSALSLTAEIAERIVVVWLGGQPRHHPHTQEFNLSQDRTASSVLLDCGVPLVRVPCVNVAEKLRTTVPELSHHLAAKNGLCDFLVERFTEYEAYETQSDTWKSRQFPGRPLAYAKEIWDVAPVAWLLDPAWCPSVTASSPRLTATADGRPCWSLDAGRPLIRECRDVHRDVVFGDLFAKLAAG